MKKLLWSALFLLTIIKADGTSHIYQNFIYQGNPESDTVLIYSQGGPSLHLDVDEFLYDILASAPDEKIRNALMVYVHQYQTKHHEVFQKKEITFAEAKKFDINTTKMFKNTIDYFKSKGKKVYLLGVSFGAFVIQDYLATYGSKDIDGAVIGVGRLLMPKAFWQAFSRGEERSYKDGVKLITTKATMGSEKDFSHRNLTKIAAGLGYKRYTKLLKDVNLSNVIYIYGEKDENVGRLSSEEIEFLHKKGVKVAKSKGGHEKAAEEFVLPALHRVMTAK